VARNPANQPINPNRSLISLPERKGGLGIPLHQELSIGLYQAAKEAALKTLYRIYSFFQAPFSPPSSQEPQKTAQEVLEEANKEKLDTFLQDLPSSYKQARLENASYLGRKWLGVLPTQ
jgi:hypothetical protein